jgi:hypothetical protein
MPVEFSCSGCGKLLRVPDEFAGKQARCPQCGAITQAPAHAAAPERDEHSTWAPPSVQPGGESGGTSEESSPYQSPLAEGSAAPVVIGEAASKVAAPAIAMIVAGGLDIAFCIFSLVINALQIAVINNGFPEGPQNLPFVPQLSVGMSIISVFASLGVSVLMVYGGLQMRQIRNYGVSIAAAIAAIVPCFGGCCFWDMPIGIWAVVVLAQGDVATAFRQNAAKV